MFDSYMSIHRWRKQYHQWNDRIFFVGDMLYSMIEVPTE